MLGRSKSQIRVWITAIGFDAFARPILAWPNGENASRLWHNLARGGSWGASARSSSVPHSKKTFEILILWPMGSEWADRS